jgi:cadmium resistance protein CadD (predicted permease)
MSWIFSAIVTGTIAFIATNIDDLVILMLFFAQANSSFRRQHIVVGQYVGFVALLLASLPGFFGGAIIFKPWIGLLGFVPIALGIRNFIQPENEVQVVNLSTDSISKKNKITALFSPQTLSVAAVTFANGGDNIGIYLSLFASQNLASLGVILGVFFVLVGVWCGVAEWLAKHQAIAPILTRYSHIFV